MSRRSLSFHRALFQRAALLQSRTPNAVAEAGNGSESVAIQAFEVR